MDYDTSHAIFTSLNNAGEGFDPTDVIDGHGLKPVENTSPDTDDGFAVYHVEERVLLVGNANGPWAVWVPEYEGGGLVEPGDWVISKSNLDHGRVERIVDGRTILVAWRNARASTPTPLSQVLAAFTSRAACLKEVNELMERELWSPNEGPVSRRSA